ncbi:glycosyltransferase [Chthonomonas calidirosea]|uniref:Glycosyltransferase n=1 Tax=Chthonomonas calidirosea (strain DSM 23976 / ICMP 18418 / T49) TaxID=1303518 RepID=S0EZK8_CHTCT|nr:glycosyltransferase family 1 protein [Chthonomonas calidirosea]CCW35883.1 Glycosyltransferase [Chthonomonas calidirosea T49]CEK18964.1 glycosyltransferase [Chthonomonas calidirosea]
MNNRVGIDGRTLTGPFTGDRSYWRGLLSAIAPLAPDLQFYVYSHRPFPAGVLPPASNLVLRVIPSRNERFWSLFTLPACARNDRCALLHVQYSVPFGCSCPVITTVHDISFRLHPEWFPWKHRLLLNIGVALAIRRATKVITVSETSRQDILRLYQCPPDRVVAIPNAISPLFFQPIAVTEAQRLVQEKYGVSTPFVLAVGVLQPRKNIETLAAAFGIAHARYGKPLALVLVGKQGWGVQEETIRARVAQYGGASAADSLVFTGYVPDEDLPFLYTACTVFAYPSLYEGFGIPPLEAMACGAPTLVAHAPPMPEVVDEAALLISPKNPWAWADALLAVLQDADLRDRLREKGPIRARCFSWEESARRTLVLYRQILATASSLA